MLPRYTEKENRGIFYNSWREAIMLNKVNQKKDNRAGARVGNLPVANHGSILSISKVL